MKKTIFLIIFFFSLHVLLFAEPGYKIYTQTFPSIGDEGKNPEIIFAELISQDRLIAVTGENERFYRSINGCWVNALGKIRNDFTYKIKVRIAQNNNLESQNICISYSNNPCTIIVDIEGAGDYTTIQEGIDAANMGDTVLVYPGIYYENINFNGKNIIVCSKYMLNNDASYIDSTVIDGNHTGSVVTFENGEDTTAVLSGFTIQHGSGTYHSFLILGGGILLIDSQASIQDCIVKNNTSQGGGGIGLYYSFINIENTTIYNNHAIFWGGGIGIYYSDINFSSTKRCNIYLNYAGEGCDLRAIQSNDIEVFVDTFTVAEPDNYFVFPLDSFSFDIQNHKIEQANNDLYVDPDGNNHNSGLSPAEPLKTISWALTKIKSDSISKNSLYLAPGTYSALNTNEMFPLNCKSYLSIIGESKNNTYLDGEQKFFLFLSRYDSCYSINDLSVKNGYSPDYIGGGALIMYSYNFKFRDVNLINNQADGGGGGIHMAGAEGIFDNVLIKGNSSDAGGGLEIRANSNPIFINCVIDSNYTLTPGWGYAGGISNNVESNSIFINCKITNNSSSECSGMTVSGGAGDYCDPMLINCTICGNSANSGGTIRQGDHSHVYLINTILRNPSQDEIVFWSGDPPKTVSISYCNVDGGIDAINTNNSGDVIWGEGNIDQDPLFVGGDPFSYQLSEDSPCIDAGTPDTTGLNLPATDLAGNPRIYNGRVDIGAYEWQDTNSVVNPDTSFINELYLFQNQPNPFKNSTEILFITSDYERVENYTLSIYNTKGQLVRRYEGRANNFSFKTKVNWDGKDSQGKEVAPGTYFYKLEYNNNAVVRKMVKVE